MRRLTHKRGEQNTPTTWNIPSRSPRDTPTPISIRHVRLTSESRRRFTIVREGPRAWCSSSGTPEAIDPLRPDTRTRQKQINPEPPLSGVSAWLHGQSGEPRNPLSIEHRYATTQTPRTPQPRSTDLRCCTAGWPGGQKHPLKAEPWNPLWRASL